MAGLTFQQWIEIEFQVLHVLSHPWDAWDDRCQVSHFNNGLELSSKCYMSSRTRTVVGASSRWWTSEVIANLETGPFGLRMTTLPRLRPLST